MGEENSINSRAGLAAASGFAVLAGLYFASEYNYLLFHVLAEGFSIAVAGGIFMVAWNSRRFLENNYVLVLGIAFLFVGSIDFLHTLSYKGMNILPSNDSNIPTQLWLSARYLQSISMLIAPLFIGRTVRANGVLASYGAVFVLLTGLVLSGYFPAAYVEGKGLTSFKIISEYVISLVSVGALFTLRSKGSAFDPKVLKFLCWAIALTIASELAFTFYVNVYGSSNLVGHYFKLVAFIAVYRAVVVTGLREPYSLLFRNLKESENRFRSLSDATFEGIIISEKGKIRDVNSQATEMFGYELPSDIVGMDCFELVAPESREMVGEVIAEGREGLYEAIFLRKDGSKFDAEVHGRMFDYHGRRARVAAIRDITEQKKSQEALQVALEESKRRKEEVEALLEGARAVLLYRDFSPAARVIFDSCRRLLGAAAGYVALLSKDGAENEVLFLDAGGLPCTVDPSLPMPIRGLRAEAYSTGNVVYDNDFSNSQWIKFMPGGHVALKNVLFAPLVIEGDVVGLMGVVNKEVGFTDDDARLAAAFGKLAAVALNNSRTLESLEEGEERFRAVAQSASDAIVSSDRDGNITFWNGAAEKVFGYGADEAIGKPLTIIVPEGFRKAHEEAFASVRANGRLKAEPGRTVELTGTRKDGTVFPVELSLSRWNTGEGVFFSAIIRDITERKLAEEELNRYRLHLEDVVTERTAELIKAYDELEEQIAEREKAEARTEAERKRFYDVFETIPAYLVLLTPDYHVAYSNGVFRRLFGEDRGRRCYELLFGRTEPCETCETYFVLKDMAPHEWEWTGPDGRNYHIHDYPFTDVDGSTLILEMGIDITERKQLESQLLQAQKMEAVGQLAGGIAHDFNNRLFAMRNYAYIVKEISTDGKVLDAVGKMLASCDRAAHLVDDLMRFSREKAINPKPVDIGKVISESKGLLKMAAGESVDFEIRLANEPLQVMADAPNIEHVLLNLVNNARDAMPHGGKITVSIESVESESSPANLMDGGQACPCAVISVSDTGLGMDEPTKSRIFDPFFTTKEVGKGTGLGLSLVYSTVKQHGGHVEVLSEPDKGATFRIYLPLLK